MTTATAAALTGTQQANAAEPLKFPTGFLWGTATSSYQVEGRGDRTADSIWDAFCRQPGKIKDGSNGDSACDSYHHYPDDIALIAKAGMKAYRFSVSWPRVLPTGVGQPDPKGLDYYSKVVDALLKAKIEPYVCLFHWDLPQALQEKGGWGNRNIAQWYADYATLMAQKLGDRVTRWVTLNEPSVHAILGHAFGRHAPGLTRQEAMLACFHHQNLAHGRGVSALRSVGGARFQIGTALSLQPARPVDSLPANQAATDLWDAVWNRAPLDPLMGKGYPVRIARSFEPLVKPGDLDAIAQKIDWIGANYYDPMYIQPDPGGAVGANWGAAPQRLGHNALGWPIDPTGLNEVLNDLRDHYGNPPVYITENGCCYPNTPGPGGKIDDKDRIAFIRDHLAAAHKAIAEKCNLRGYFAWSIIDNFEWAEGYTAPFGLVAVDRATMKRTPKASYDWLAKVVRSNSV